MYFRKNAKMRHFREKHPARPLRGRFQSAALSAAFLKFSGDGSHRVLACGGRVL